MVIGLSLGLFAVDATMKIEKDVDQRVHVAIIDGSESGGTLGHPVFDILQADLKISGHFLPDAEYHEGTYAGNTFAPAFRSNEYVLKYRVDEFSGGVTLRVKLLRGNNSALRFEKKYTIASAARYPFLVHKAVTDLNGKLGFSSIEWINRYLLFARYTGKKESEIVLADYTFHYIKTILRGGLNLFPVWGDPQQKIIYYTGYSGKLPTLYRLDLSSGERRRILGSQGMLVCSDVSRDGRRLLLTKAPNGQPDIYEYDLNTSAEKRLTFFSGIDVGGKYADGEQNLVFVSNRLGYPNIFKKPLGGGPVSPLVFHGHNNDSCDVFENKVVYSSRENDNSFGNGKAFNLYLTLTDGSDVRPLTSGGINQFPRFSNDGNTVLYIKRSYEGNAIGYIGLGTNLSMLFPLGNEKIQAIDW